MKKKSELTILLDDLRSQDPKKRLASVMSIKDISAAIGHTRTRTQFLHYLTEFVDDQQNIVLELLNQLSDFRTELGGEQHEKQLLPLLMSFCKTDNKPETQRAIQIMEPILVRNKDLIVDTIKKLAKTEMCTSKHAASYLTARLIQYVPQHQSPLLQIFSGMVFSEIPSYKIIASKHITKLLEQVKNKQEVGKMLEVIYNDNDDLPKIFAMEALVDYYGVNGAMVVSKFRNLVGLGNWRISVRICEVVNLCLKAFGKAVFKSTFEGWMGKCLVSSEPELRAKACCLLKPLAIVLSDDEIKKTLIPLLKKLATDSVDYVKVALSQNIVSLVEVMPGSLINEELLPLIFSFMKSNDLAIGIIKSFETLTKKFTSDMIEEKILTPLVTQLNTEDWKTKCQLIDLLTGVISNSFFLNDQLTTMLVHLAEDKINAVRQKATQLIINIICQQSPQWCDSMLIPKITCLKQSPNYIQRQIMLQIIEKTSDKVSQKTLTDVYRQTVFNNLSDKVPNVRVKALKVLKNGKRVNDGKMFEKVVEKLKGDTDAEVKRCAGEVGVGKG